MLFGEFEIGMRIVIYDEDERKNVRGTVSDINKDKKVVFIKWDDINNICEHDNSELTNFSRGYK